MPAERGWLAGLHQNFGAEINSAAHIGENADHRDQRRAQSPITTIFKWVARSALYIEWFMTILPLLPIGRSSRAQGFVQALHLGSDGGHKNASSPNLEDT